MVGNTGTVAGERRLLFGQVAELYDRARPAYPREMVDDVLAFAAAAAGDRALEVGAGTGKATRLFAARGLSVLALEPSPEMAAVARDRLAGEPRVAVEEREFESWKPGGAQFRLVYAAQAWHWIAPEVGYRQARRALEAGGALAVFWNRPRWPQTPLRDEFAAAYQRLAPELVDRRGPMHPAGSDDTHWMTDWDADLAGAAGFAEPEQRDYVWTQPYTSREYVRLLGTHSDHLTLSPARLEQLQSALAALIDAAGGRLELPYTTRLLMARATS